MNKVENSMRQLIEDATQEYKERRKEYPDEDAQEVINEVADAWVPIYTADLLELALDDMTLATYEPEIHAFNGEKTAINAIAGNIYERLIEALQEVANEENES